MLDLLVTPQFRKDLKKIPHTILTVADVVIISLRSNPLDPKFDIKKLVNFKPAMWRLRIGQYRLVYSFDKQSLILHRFRHRKDIYRDFN